MLAYATQSRRVAGRAGSPRALTLIVAGHAVLIAAVMTARMDVAGPVIDQIPKLIPIDPLAPPPPPPPPQPKVEPQPKQPSTQETFIDKAPPKVDMGQTMSIALDKGPPLRDLLTDIRPGKDIVTAEPARPAPVKVAALFRTPDHAVKPPYPNDKLREEEEATLRLRLTIDARGRVIAVDPVGAADPSFLEAARRHIIRAWRYKPATEDGVAVPSTMVINLSFRLEDV